MQSCDPEATFVLCHLGLLPKSLNENRKKRGKDREREREEGMRREGKEGGKQGKCQRRVNTKRLSSRTRDWSDRKLERHGASSF